MSTRLTRPAERRRTVGVLGGMGPMATLAFYERLLAATHAESDQEHLRVVIESDTRIPDRTAHLLGRGPDPTPVIAAAAERLEASGADLIVMPCNTAQHYLPRLRERVRLPFVPWIETAVDAAVELDRGPVGILATRGTLQVDLYGPRLEEHGLEPLRPTEQEIDRLMAAIYDFKSGDDDPTGNKTLVIDVAAAMVERGARSFLLACTELPLILPHDDDRWPAPAIDPAEAVARLTVREAGGQPRDR